MNRYIVGVDGEHTPDPEYWRARNEIITAKDEEEAKEIWEQKREGWYAGEPISIAVFPYTEEQKQFPNASDWQFVKIKKFINDHWESAVMLREVK